MLTIEDLKKPTFSRTASRLPVLDIAEFHADAGEQIVL